MTPNDLAAAADIPPDRAARWAPHVTAAAERFGFAAPLRLAMWVAQVGHESGGFRFVRESLNYSAAALRANWPKRFTEEEAARCARNPEAIANRAYGGRMGNGPPESGDGWAFRGRGLIQITGRANYRACGRALGVDCEAVPQLLETPDLAAMSAGWYWQARALNLPADHGDVVAVTRTINGGTNGLDDRYARYRRALGVLMPAAAVPVT